MQEMGIDLLPTYSHKFLYRIQLGELIEHEVDHIYIGKFDGQPTINKEEAEDWKYMGTKEIRTDILANPDRYSHWFKLIMEHLNAD